MLKEGHWYKWIGPKERQSGWNAERYMDFILDGKPHKCIKAGGIYWVDMTDTTPIGAFEDQPCDEIIVNSRIWVWYGGEEYLVEVNPRDENGNLLFDFY